MNSKFLHYKSGKIRSKTWGKIGISILLVLYTLAAIPQYLHAQGMACNDLVQLSLNDNCTITVVADLILEDPSLPDNNYKIEIFNAANVNIGTTTLNQSHRGQTLTVHVTNMITGITCWGQILVQDKIPPVIQNCVNGFLPDITVDCTDYPTLYKNKVPNPTVIDNCGNAGITFQSVDEANTDLCSPDGFAYKIKRTWVVSDKSGSTATCMQMIKVKRASLDDVVFPPHYNDADGESPSISCDYNESGGGAIPISSLDLLSNGNPSTKAFPRGTGYPTLVDCRNLQVAFQDTRFEICGSSYKVLRRWNVIDWCTGGERYKDQVIKLVDTRGPVVTCPADTIKVSSSPGKCTGTLTRVPDPIKIFDCSETTYTVAYKLRDASGNPFINPITDNVYTNSDGSYGIKDLPLDTTWLVYTVTDACGHSTQCFTEIVVEDHEPPSAVCEGNTVVTLSPDGWADVYATSIDDHSLDNCMIDRFEVRRKDSYCPGKIEDLTFGEKVNFCCSDIPNNPIKVVFRVYDKSGNYSDCIVNIDVQDKEKPKILSCPSNLTLSCTADYENLALTGGSPVYEDNCDALLTYKDTRSLNSCGVGVVIRRWTVTDPSGNTAACSQSIVISDIPKFGLSNITFPANTTITGCKVEDADYDITGKPTYTGDQCVSLTAGKDDQAFYNVEGVCIKLLRTWTVIDWCRYDVSSNSNDAIWSKTQVIKINSTQAPTFTSGCSNKEALVTTNCSGYIDLVVQASDGCTAASDLKYTYEIDFNFNQSQGFVKDISGIGNDASGTYPAGKHRINFTVENACGKTNSCAFFFTIKDNKAPTPICYGELSFSLGNTGSKAIWASDFIKEVVSNCNSSDNYTLSFNPSFVQSNYTFTCADFSENGAIVRKKLKVYATDPDGNQSFCEVVAVVTDNDDICPNTSNANANISGLITSDAMLGIRDIPVVINRMSEQTSDIIRTGDNGDYAFQDLSLFSDYKLSPDIEDSASNGVSTLDLVLIQQHILGLKSLPSPYKLVAADINNSGHISAIDLIELRKIILGVQTEYSNNENWRFVDANYEFPDPKHPIDFPEYIMVENLIENKQDVNFVGIKIGDVNGSVKLNGFHSTEVRSNQDAVISIPNLKFDREQLLEVPLSFVEAQNIEGMQFAIEFDSETLEFVRIESGKLPIRSENYSSHLKDRGVVTLSWNDMNGFNLESGESAIKLIFKSHLPGKLENLLKIGSTVTQAELYHLVDNSISTIKYRYDEIEDNSKGQQVILYQNSPNPFESYTKIPFHLPEAGVATFKVYDISGRTIFSTKSYFEKGRNEIMLDQKALKISGVLYYQLQIGDFSEIRKMISIQ